MKKKSKLPKTLYVAHKFESASPVDSYFIADETSEIFDDGEFVGEYRLVKIGKKSIKHTIE